MYNKKTFRRIISYVIIIVFLLQSTLGVFADSAGKNPAADSGAKPAKKELPKAAMAKTEKLYKLPPGLVKKEDALDRWKGKKEIIESRTENSKTYQNEDGTYTTAVFMSPIHIKDNKGNLVDIDNTLVPLKTGEYSHKNKLGAFDVFFTGEDKEIGSIKMEKDNISVEMTSKDATTKNMVVEGSSVLYQGTESGVEHLYTVDFNGVKEDIILNRGIDEPVFIYELDVKGPADVIQRENMVLVVDKKSEEPVFTLSAPFMEDKEGSQSFNLSMQLSQEKGKNIVTVTADKQWLDDPARVYPVRIDPSIGVEYSKDKDMVDDNFTQVYKSWLTHYDEEYIYVGYDNGIKSTNGSDAKGKTRGYIKFDIPDAVNQNEGIISAEIGLYKYTHWSSSTRQMNVWELPENTSINNLTWTNQPQPGNTILTVPITSYVGWYKLNVTQMMNTWVTRDNFVLGMKMQDESNSADCFRSTDYKTSSMWPYLKITYNKEPVEEIPIEQGDLELVLERDDKMQTGTAYAKATLEGGSPESGENKATIEYKLMPDGPSGTIVEENFSTLDWETEKFELQVDKTYWIEANVKLEHLIVPVSEDPLIPPPEPYYEEVLNETKQTSKFVVGEVQPGDTLKRLSKHYLNAGNKYTEISQLNKLSEEALTVGQKLFVLTDKSKALSYKQPQQITPEIELKDMTAGSQPVNTELVGQFINPHNGNFAYSNMDFGYSSYNLDIALVRSHSSIVENRKSPIGDKWDYSFNKYLFFYNDGTIGYNTGDGSRIYFRQQGGVYKTSAPVYDVLTKTGDYYEIKTADNIRYQFSNTGLLTKILDKNNNETIVAYNDNDWQSTITDAAARMIAFDYYDSDTQWSGNIRTITMPDGSAVNYTYDSGANTLESYIDPEGYDTVYSYDSKQRLQTLTNGRGIISITNGYDGSGRVQTQYDGKNVPVKLQYSAGVTTFTDGKGYPYYYSYNDKLWLTNKKYPDNISESYTHNAKGDIRTRVDRMGKTHSYDYNALGFVTKYTRPDTKYMEYRYENDYLLEYIRDFAGNQTNLYYDGNNNLDREVRYVTDNGQRVQVTTDYSFTPEGLIASVSDPDGVTTTFDNSGYPLYQAVFEESNDPYQYFFDSMGRLTTMIDPKLNVTNTTYDNRGNTTFVIYPGSYDIDRYTIYDYDENGNLISQTSSRVLPIGGIQPTTIYSYDNNDRLESITDPYGYKTSYSYDKNGNLELEKDQEDYETTYVYDNLNRLKNIKYPGQTGYAYTYEYDNLSNTKKVIEADGDWTSYTYDYNVNKIKTIEKPEGYSVSYTYDGMGNIKIETLPDNNAIYYSYDELYRVKTIQEPGSKFTTVDYKNSGRVEKIRDYTEKTYTYEYYPDGQLWKTNELYKDPLTSEDIKYEVTYTYDANGNMKTVKDENGHTTTYEYNEINKVAKVLDPQKKTTSYEYDEDGNVSNTTDGEGNVTRMQYDALSRLYTVTISDEGSANTLLYTASTAAEDTVHTYLYNSRGMLEYYIDPMQNPTTYHYNPLGKLDTVSNAKNEEVSYDYYPDGTLQKVTYPNQQFEEYRYDSLNRAVWTKDRAGVEQTVAYTVTGQPDLITDNVGNKLDYIYDQLGRVDTIKDTLGRTESYQYDRAGNVKEIKGMDNSITKYTYDPRGRVRMMVDTENKPTIMEYNGQNQVVLVEKPGSRKYTYEYDTSGNLWRVTDPAENETKYYYNGNNQVEEIVDARGYSKKYEYNALNKLEKVINEREFPTIYDYYPGGHLKTVKDAKGFETNYQYDELNRIAAIENPLKEKTSYTYDSMGNVDTIKDERGVTTRYKYNARDQVEYTYDTQGNRTSRIYYPNGDLRKHIDEENNVTSYLYDTVHRITKQTESGGYEQNYVYSPVTGDISRVYDNAGKSTVYTHDNAHRLLTETNEQGHLTEYTYDDFGNLESKKTPDGNVTTYGYDILDRVTSILDPENQLTEIHYDPMGNIDTLVKPDNQKYTYFYDPANNVEKVIDPLGQATIYTYDPNNNVATMLDPSGNLLTYNYDALNRLQTVMDSNNSGEQYHYDKSGNIDSITDGNNNTTYYGYDNLNRLEWVKDAEGNTTRYTYFNDGKLKSMTDANGNTSSYTYDKAGNLATYKNPLGETKAFQYTLLNQIKSISNPDGKQINYDYDEFNRLSKISYAGGDTVEYAYDELNRKIGMSDENGVSEYDYDDMGRLTYYSDAAGEEVKYEYDSKGRKSKLVYPDGKFVTYEYDEHDRLVTVTDREGRQTTYTYDDAGRQKTTSYPNGITTTYTYDKTNRIVDISNAGRSGNIIEKISYGYDGAGNRIREEIQKEDKHYLREYTYYKNNTVMSMTESGDNNTDYSYKYDAAGNITEKTVTKDGVSTQYNYIYNEANRMTEEKENGITTRLYRYDANGNRIAVVISAEEEVLIETGAEAASDTTASAPAAANKGKGNSKDKGDSAAADEVEEEEPKEVADYYTFDDAGRLVEIVEHNGKVFTYGYDGEGNRLWRTYTQYSVLKKNDKETGNDKEPKVPPGQDKDKSNNGKDKNLTGQASLTQMFMSAAEKNSKDKNKDNNEKEEKVPPGQDKDKDNNGNDKEKETGNDKEKTNNGRGSDRDLSKKGAGWERAKDKSKAKTDRGKHLGWYKRTDHPKYPEGIDLNNPEVFQVTNYVNDISLENEEVLMTSDVDGNYRGVYTYGIDRISEEDLVSVEGKPNDPLYYLYDALGTTTSITNMNEGIIDSNRFAPYGEPIDPVAKNSRLTNSSFGYTGELHDIEAGTVYLRARYYEPGTMRFISQDTMFGDIMEPLSRNLYIYGNANPMTYVDPSGHVGVAKYGETSENVRAVQKILIAHGYWTNPTVGATGYFGEVTKNSLIKFQKEYMKLSNSELYNSNGAYVACGPRTAAALTALANNKPSVDKPIDISEQDNTMTLEEYEGLLQYIIDYGKELASNRKYVYDPWNWQDELQSNIEPLINMIPSGLSDELRTPIVDAIIIAEAQRLQAKYLTVYTASDNFISKYITERGLHQGLEPLYEQYPRVDKITNPLVRAFLEGFVDGFYAGIWYSALSVNAKNIDDVESATEYARRVGKAGEQAAGIVKNTKHINSLTNTANYRIPDGLDDANKVIQEVKNVKYQGLTNQIRDFIAYAKDKGYTFELFVKPDTKISKSLQELIDKGEIIIKYLNQ